MKEQISTSARLAEAVEAYAAAHRSQRLRLRDLAASVGVSERRVRYAFEECHRQSPTAYLRERALSGVREELLTGTPGISVTSVASDFGFWHLGRFSAQYRRLFGESPSDTLRQAPSRTHALG